MAVWYLGYREGREDGVNSEQHVRLEVISEKDSNSDRGRYSFVSPARCTMIYPGDGSPYRSDYNGCYF